MKVFEAVLAIAFWGVLGGVFVIWLLGGIIGAVFMDYLWAPAKWLWRAIRRPQPQ